MAIKWFEKNGIQYVDVMTSCRSKIDPTIRKQPRRRFHVERDKMTLKKAKQEERKLEREALIMVMHEEQKGMSFERLLGLYELHAMKLMKIEQWSQSKTCLMDSISSLRRFASDWLEDSAKEINSAKITRLLHKLKLDGYADCTVKRFLGDLKKVFNFAICEELLPGVQKNPTVGISIKSRRRKRDEILLYDEIKKLLTYGKLYEQKWYFIWAFAVYTGMRNGELYALKWSDIEFDPENSLIRVSRSYNKRLRLYKSTKTGESREIPICEPLMKVIDELKKWWSHEQARNTNVNLEFVLPRPGLWSNGSQAQVLRKFCTEIGITPVCFHSLRACFATELLKRGVPVTKVMAVGGWAELKTMKHYVRLSGINVRGVTDALDFSSPEASIYPDREMMKAVGEKYSPDEDELSKVIPLTSRKLTMLK